MKSTADSTKTKVPLNINWDSNKNVWHIMVLSDYIEIQRKTLIPFCQSHLDKKDMKTSGTDLHRDWFDNPIYRFPDGNNFKKGIKYPDLNFKNICSACVSKTNIEEFKIWLTVQKLKHL